MCAANEPKTTGESMDWAAPDPIEVQIETPRLVIRPFVAADAPGLFSVIASSRHVLMPWLPWSEDDHRDEERTLHFIVNQRIALRTPAEMANIVLGVFDRDTGEVVGGTGLHRIEPKTAAGEIGYWMAAHAQGQGLCTEATRHLLSFVVRSRALGGWGLARILIVCSAENVASKRVPEKLGLPLEGRLRADLYVRGIGATDRLIYGVLADAWDHEGHRMRAQKKTEPA